MKKAEKNYTDTKKNCTQNLIFIILFSIYFFIEDINLSVVKSSVYLLSNNILFNQTFSFHFLLTDSSILKYAQLPCSSSSGCVQVFHKSLGEFMSNTLQVEGKYVFVQVRPD